MKNGKRRAVCISPVYFARLEWASDFSSENIIKNSKRKTVFYLFGERLQSLQTSINAPFSILSSWIRIPPLCLTRCHLFVEPSLYFKLVFTEHLLSVKCYSLHLECSSARYCMTRLIPSGPCSNIPILERPSLTTPFKDTTLPPWSFIPLACTVFVHSISQCLLLYYSIHHHDVFNCSLSVSSPGT